MKFRNKLTAQFEAKVQHRKRDEEKSKSLKPVKEKERKPQRGECVSSLKMLKIPQNSIKGLNNQTKPKHINIFYQKSESVSSSGHRRVQCPEH